MSLKDILNTIEYLEIYNSTEKEIENIVIDTRKVKINDCYIGIKGEKNNGNLFYMDAFNNGANTVILDEFELNDEIIKYLNEFNKTIIVVKNSVLALGDIAKYIRNNFHNPVVAVTGSAGKTSTKDMIYSVLNEKYNAHKTIGNQNNHLGLPLTVLSLKESNEVLVLEMGMNHEGEIHYLTNIAKPDVAVITNVGTAHIGNLGSRENILKAKLEILDGLNKNGTLIINNDNDLLHKWYIENKGNYNIITVGINEQSDFLASNIIMNENGSTFNCKGITYDVPIGGEHFIYNALVAIAVSSIFDVDNSLVQKGILNFELSNNRMHIINKESPNITIIDDSYNANFDSMRYAIKYLSSLDGRNIAVLGTMKELGEFSEKFHRDIGGIVKNEDIDILITVGDDAAFINESAVANGFNKENSYNFKTNVEAVDLINSLKQDNDNYLVKASNSLNFKEIVERISK